MSKSLAIVFRCVPAASLEFAGEEFPVVKAKKQLLTADDVAEMLQIARKTVVVMAREQRIPCIRIGRFVRFDPAEIDRWIDSQRS